MSSDPLDHSQPLHYVAIDLGSNSFHMLVARYNDGTLEKIDRVKEMVQIGRGLRSDGTLDDEAQERALHCLERFSERISAIPAAQVRAVGTKALRMTRHSGDFFHRMEKTLGHSIQVISGYEEARLIYLGIVNDIHLGKQKRLVIDIGGGSTEVIIGQSYTPKRLESLSLGCVSYAKRFFSDYNITEAAMRKAQMAAQEEVEQIRKEYLQEGWEQAIGASGTIRALADLMPDCGGSGIITLDNLLELRNRLLRKGNEILAEVSPQRRMVLPAGLAILIGIFKELKLDQLQAADGTLKEGLIYDTIGRNSSGDVREQTVQKMIERFGVDTTQSDMVYSVADNFFQSLLPKISPLIPTGLNTPKLLKWAAQLHEIGLSISHSGFHRHGHYLIRNMDMAGFSRLEQRLLATLIGLHRRKWQGELLEELPESYHPIAKIVGIILRLSAVLSRSRSPKSQDLPSISLENNTFSLKFAQNWLEEHPLSLQSLERESHYLHNQEFTLSLPHPKEG
ncbi:MAG: Ppx/GppA family phosphatase [Cellvibrionaceae bacterium]